MISANRIRPPVVALALAIGLCAGCRQPPPLPSPLDYPAYLRAVTPRVCAKMLQCYAKLTFTIPARYRTAMTVEGCRDAALENIDQKMRYQTESIRAWSVLCYDAILKSDCSQIGTAAFFNPACVRLRDESTQALQRRP